MFRLWLEFPAPYVLMWLVGFFSMTGLIIHWLSCHSPFSRSLKQWTLVAPYFASVSILFALFVGFLLANAVSQKNRAFQAVQKESTALLILNVRSDAAPAHAGAIREAIRAYAGSAVADEWPQLIDERSSPQTEAALLALLRAVGTRAIAEEAGQAVHSQMLSLTEQVAEARAERVAIVMTHAQRFAWTALFLLGVLTQVAISLAHLERVQTNILALVLFTLSAVTALWLIAIQENPFRGAAGVSPAPMQSVMQAAG